MVAPAARAPSISRRMKPTSSKSGATHAGVSSLRFRRAIGRSEAGGASKTFAHGKGPPQIAQRETYIRESGLALRHRLEDVKGPAMVSDLVTDRQFPPLEPPRLRKRVRRFEPRHAVEVELVVERHVPCAAVPLERFDVIEPRFQTGQAELLLQDPRAGALGMLEIGQLIVGQEPSAIVVVLRHVAVPDEQHLALGEKRDVGDQGVDPALGFQWEILPAVSSPTDGSLAGSNLLRSKAAAVAGGSTAPEPARARIGPGALASRSRIAGSSRASRRPRGLRRTRRDRRSGRGPMAWTRSCSRGRAE